MFLIFNLKLMEVNKLEVISHLLLVLDLGLSLGDLAFKRVVLQSKLANQSILCTLLVLHVLHKLFGIVLSSSAILSSREEATEIEGLLSNLSNGEICAFQNGLESFQKGL